MRELDLTVGTIYAQLIQQGLDAEFEAEFPETGTMVLREIKGKNYWYYSGYDKASGKKVQKYVGPASNPGIASRLEQFQTLKSDFKTRRQLVMALRGAGVFGPDTFVGDVINALRKAGVFRLRCVLVGTVAYQCYAPMLGVILRPELTKDADLAQFHSVSVGIGEDESLPPLLDVLRSVDPTFREVTHRNDPSKVIALANKNEFQVEFLTPNRSKDEYQDHAAEMPALGPHMGAQPLRYLDFLIHDPIRAVMLHGAGVPVTVPKPERYAVHKLIVATQRRTDGEYGLKRDKDLSQAGELIEAMHLKRRWLEFTEGWMEAWDRGPAWREALRRGRAMLPNRESDLLADCVARGAREMDANPSQYGIGM